MANALGFSSWHLKLPRLNDLLKKWKKLDYHPMKISQISFAKGLIELVVLR